MFNDVGNKIKVVAKIITWAGILISILLGIVEFKTSFFRGLAIIVIGSLVAWVGSFFLYGMGEIIENTSRMIELSNDQRILLKELQSDVSELKKDIAHLESEEV